MEEENLIIFKLRDALDIGHFFNTASPEDSRNLLDTFLRLGFVRINRRESESVFLITTLRRKKADQFIHKTSNAFFQVNYPNLASFFFFFSW